MQRITLTTNTDLKLELKIITRKTFYLNIFFDVTAKPNRQCGGSLFFYYQFGLAPTSNNR